VRGPFNALLLYIWVAYFRPEQWVWGAWVREAHLSIVVGTILVLLTIVTLRPDRLKLTGDIALLLLFLVQATLSTVFSQAPAWSQAWWFEFAKVMLVGYLIVVHVDSVQRLRVLLVVMALSLGLESVKQGYAHFLLAPGQANTNPHPALGDNNGVALGMFMLAPIAGALATTAARRWEQAFWWVLTAGVVFRGITTYSRGGLLAAGALAVFYAWGNRRNAVTLLVTAGLAATVYVAMPQQFWARWDGITVEGYTVSDASMAARLHFWKTAVLMAEDYPVTGVGFNAYPFSYDKYDLSLGDYGTARAVHSTWFGTLAELGWPGLVLLVSILVRAGWGNGRVRSRLRLSSAPGAAALGQFGHALFAAIVAYVVGGTFLHAQYNEMFWHLAWTSTAVPLLAREMTESTSRKSVQFFAARPASAQGLAHAP
jgi:probable O-glycosylation ligase (exosortase A-associated)